MRQPVYSSQFKRDFRQAQKRGKGMDKLKTLLALLALLDFDCLRAA